MRHRIRHPWKAWFPSLWAFALAACGADVGVPVVQFSPAVIAADEPADVTVTVENMVLTVEFQGDRQLDTPRLRFGEEPYDAPDLLLGSSIQVTVQLPAGVYPVSLVTPHGEVIWAAERISAQEPFNGFSVVYDANGGSEAPEDPTLYAPGDLVQIIGPKNMFRPEYTFVAWNTRRDGSGTAHRPEDEVPMPAAGLVLYAQWASSGMAYEVRYDANGAGGTPPPTERHLPGNMVTVQEPADLRLAGATFEGWQRTETAGRLYQPGDSFVMPAEDVVLSAQWTRPTPGRRFELLETPIIPAFGHPEILASGDFDGDEFEDLLVRVTDSDPADGESSGLQAWLGDDREKWKDRIEADINSDDERILQVEVADLDGDGDSDLVARSESKLWVLEHDGRAGFSVEKGPNVKGLSALWIADMDGQGCPDVVWTACEAEASCQVGVRLGPDGGDCEAVFDQDILTQVDDPEQVEGVLTHLNLDDRWDLVVLRTRLQRLELFVRQDDGQFGAPQSVPLSHDHSQLVAGEFDGRSGPDLAVASREGHVEVLYGGTNLQTPLEAPKPIEAGGGQVVALQAHDLDGDGQDELMALDAAFGQMTVYRAGAADALEVSARYDVGVGPNSMAVLDVHGDGHSDVVAANGHSENLSVLMGSDGGATLLASRSLRTGRVAESLQPIRVRADDVNGDGSSDLTILNRGNGTLMQFLAPSSSFSALTPRPIELSTLLNPVPAEIHARDLIWVDWGMNDKRLFVAVNAGLYGYATDPNGLPVGSPSVEVLSGSESFVASVATGDFDGDGRADVVGSRHNESSVMPQLLWNSPGGARSTLMNTNTAGPGDAGSVVVTADFNQDDVMDFAHGRPSKDRVYFYFGGRDRGVRSSGQVRVDRVQDVATGDFNGDTWPDLVAVSQDSSDGVVWLNDGSGGFGQTGRWSLNGLSGARYRSLAVADLDGDENLDLIATIDSDAVDSDAIDLSHHIAVFAGRGDGDFALPEIYRVGARPSHVAVGDFDRNQRPDLAVASEGQGKVVILFNRSPM